MQKIKDFFDLIDTDTGTAWFISAMIVLTVVLNPIVIAYLIIGGFAAAAIIFVGTPIRRWLALRRLEKSFVKT